jgi:putative endonuclease
MNWQVYIILCTDNSLYTGITSDIERRMLQHATSRGAKYFRGRKPQQLVYLENDHTRSSASKREAAIKKLKRPEKEVLIASAMNELGGLVATEQQPPGGI